MFKRKVLFFLNWGVGEGKSFAYQQIPESHELGSILGKVRSGSTLQHLATGHSHLDTTMIYSWSFGSLEMLSRFSTQNISCVGDKELLIHFL